MRASGFYVVLELLTRHCFGLYEFERFGVGLRV